VALTVTPLEPGYLRIRGLQYASLHARHATYHDSRHLARFDLSWGGGDSIHGCTLFELKGPRLNTTPNHKSGIFWDDFFSEHDLVSVLLVVKAYGPDRRLEPHIMSAMPRLETQV
jgi:hypothetical protein